MPSSDAGGAISFAASRASFMPPRMAMGSPTERSISASLLASPNATVSARVKPSLFVMNSTAPPFPDPDGTSSRYVGPLNISFDPPLGIAAISSNPGRVCEDESIIILSKSPSYVLAKCSDGDTYVIGQPVFCA